MMFVVVAVVVWSAAFGSLCHDLEDACGTWAASGECERNLGYMKLHACKRSCGSCGLDTADIAPAAVRSTAAEKTFLTRTRSHGSCEGRPQNLLWGADAEMASTIGCFNRRGAEPSGYWQGTRLLEALTSAGEGPVTFYDSVTSRPLFVAPINRTMASFINESILHGWPSFRDEELLTEGLRVLPGSGGEVVSVDGIHLGHNLPDARNRYCINLVSIAGKPR